MFDDKSPRPAFGDNFLSWYVFHRNTFVDNNVNTIVRQGWDGTTESDVKMVPSGDLCKFGFVTNAQSWEHYFALKQE